MFFDEVRTYECDAPENLLGRERDALDRIRGLGSSETSEFSAAKCKRSRDEH